MPTVRLLTLVLFMSLRLAAQPSPGDSKGPSLAAGQPVFMTVTAGTDSERARVGDLVRLEVIEPVKAGDLVAIPAATEVEAVVQSARPRGHRGAAGSLTFAFREVRTVTGERVALAGNEKRSGEDRRGQNNADVNEVIFETLGFGAPLAPVILLQKGGSARLDVGTRIIAWVGQDVKLDAVKLAATQRSNSSGLATIYVLHGWHPSCGSVQLPFDFLYKSTVRLEVPPGKYWFHAGATGSLWRGIGAGVVAGFTYGAAMPQPVSLKVLRRPIDEFTAIEAEAGRTYYLLASEDAKTKVHWRVSSIDAEKGEEMVKDSEASYYILRDFKPETLAQLQAAPQSAVH